MYQNRSSNNNVNNIINKGLRIAAIVALLAFSQGCASKTPGQPLKLDASDEAQTSTQDSGHKVGSAQQPDYLEPVNRGIFRFNEVLDGMLLKPLVHIYWGVMPDFGQTAVRNILTNLSSPVVFLNSVLQGDSNNAAKTLGRFVINSTVGIAGTFDVATDLGIEKEHKKDFGQTMGVYGVGTGTYVVLPLLGPSDVRDTFGLVADVFSDPFTYIFTTNESLARAAVAGIVRRGDAMPVTDRVYRDSLDPYAALRSVYLQNRDKVVRDYRGANAQSVNQAH